VNLPALTFPEYDSFRVKKNAKHVYYNQEGERYLITTPYQMSVQDLAKALITHNVKLPFDSIITMDMGVSVCPYCKAKYVGNQVYCTNQVRWFHKRGGYSSDWHRGDQHVGDKVTVGDGYYKNSFVVGETSVDLCDTEVVWDLQKEFDEQKAFFSFVSMINGCASHPDNLLERFKNALPPGVAAEYRIQMLESENVMLRGQVDQLQYALKQIAERMNAAGHCLIFGF
jgi:hypothetical protein